MWILGILNLLLILEMEYYFQGTLFYIQYCYIYVDVDHSKTRLRV